MAYPKVPPVNAPYFPDALSQLDGSPAAYHNCGLTVGAELANTESLGYWTPKPAALRALTGLPNTVGTTYPQIIDAVKAATKGQVILRPLYHVPASAIPDALASGRAVGVMIDCSVTIDTPYHTGTYTGLHEDLIVAQRYATVKRADGTTYQQRQYAVMDPGRSTYYVRYEWVPAALIDKAAKAVTSDGTVLILTTRDLTNVSRVARASGPIFTKPAVTSTNGSVVAGRAYTVLGTVRGASYPANGHTAKGWNKLGATKFVGGLRIR